MATESMRRHAGSPRPQPGSDEKPHEAESRPCGSVLRAALADELVAAAVSLRDMLAGAHLDESIDRHTRDLPSASAKAVRNMAYDATRQQGLLAWLGERFNRRQPTPLLAALQALGMAQLIDARRPVPVIIDQTVRAVGKLPEGAAHPGAAGFINATLRRFARERASLMAEPLPDEARFNHPGWWVAKVRKLWPDRWQEILTASLSRAPLSLRANRRQGGQLAAAARLQEAGIGFRLMGQDGLVLDQALPVDRIPGFAEGLMSVQDIGAQCAAQLLDPQPGERILDACAAPGGKTAHLLEMADCEVWALDIDPDRASIITNNLQRARVPLLSQDATEAPDAATSASGQAAGGVWGAHVLAADAGDPESWWDGRPFDRILLDAPCGAIPTCSGIASVVILRHFPPRRRGSWRSFGRCCVPVVHCFMQHAPSFPRRERRSFRHLHQDRRIAGGSARSACLAGPTGPRADSCCPVAMSCMNMMVFSTRC